MVIQLKEQFEKHLKELKFNDNSLYDPVKYILSIGGKRARPILCILAANMYKPNLNSIYNVATAIEYFHNFSLMHDDIMDEADLRRGKQTVHTKFDTNAAILSGDVMLVNAFQFLQNFDAGIFKKLSQILGKTAVDVCEGQQLDMTFESRFDVSEQEYINMITHKTAALIGASIQMGAIAASASEEDSKNLYEFGKNIGISFQILDDFLDCFGGENFGKKIGGDILQNKKTYLTINAFALANSTEKAEIKEWIDKKEYIQEDKINFFLKLFKRLEIDILAQQKAKFYHNEALQHLNKINHSSDKTKPIVNYANMLLKRLI